MAFVGMVVVALAVSLRALSVNYHKICCGATRLYLVSFQVIIAQERLVSNAIRVFKSREKKYEYVAEIRSVAEDSTRMPSMLQLKMCTKNREVIMQQRPWRRAPISQLKHQ